MESWVDFATYQAWVLYLYECFVTFSSRTRVISTGYDSPVAACKHVHKIQNGDLLHLIRLDYLLLLELTFLARVCRSSALYVIEKLVSCLRLLVGFRDGLWYFHLSRLAISGIRPVSESNTTWPQGQGGGGGGLKA